MSDKKIEVFSPVEIKDNYTHTQIEQQAKILGINKDILIRFNQDMKKQVKPINLITLEQWAISEAINEYLTSTN